MPKQTQVALLHYKSNNNFFKSRVGNFFPQLQKPIPPGIFYPKFFVMKANLNKQLFLLALLFPLLSIAQNEDQAEKKNTFTANVSYQSALHFFGRTDNLQSAGLFPTVGFELKNGIYANSNFIFIQNEKANTQYTGTTIEAGYKFGSDKKLNGNIFFTSFLYNDKTALVQSALKSQTGVNLTFNNNIININTGADLKFSNKTDLGLTTGLDHLFIIRLRNKMAIAINPSVYAYAGTQNFSNTYIKNISPILPIFPAQTEQQTEEKTTFNILAYEVASPIVWVAGKFNCGITPAFVIPQNLIEGENGKNLFYISCSVGIRL